MSIFQTQNNGTNKYSLIADYDDLTAAWVQFHNNLGYPLKKESYRDRYLIYNKQGLEQEIEKTISTALEEAASKIMDEVAAGAINEITAALQPLSANKGFSINLIRNNQRTSKLTNMINEIARNTAKGVIKITENAITENLNKR